MNPPIFKQENFSVFETNINSGIYFLLQGSEVVYVGQSVNIPTRIKTHNLNKDMVFDSWNYISLSVNKLDETEFNYIRKLTPKFNKKIPSIKPKLTRKIIAPKKFPPNSFYNIWRKSSPKEKAKIVSDMDTHRTYISTIANGNYKCSKYFANGLCLILKGKHTRFTLFPHLFKEDQVA